MEQGITDEVERLATMPVQQLRARYREVYGEDSRSGHKQHLVRRIAWRLQVLAQGDLTERASGGRGRLANDADLKTQVPRAGRVVPRSERAERAAGTAGCR